MLYNDVNQRSLTASYNPNGQVLIGIGSVDLNAGNLTVWNQVVQSGKTWKCTL